MTGRRSGRARLGAVLALLGALAGSASAAAAQEPADFLMVKLGDEAATPEMAGAFLASLGRWLEGHVPRFEGRGARGSIANTLEDAKALLAEREPVLAFVPAEFYLGLLRDGPRAARPVAQIPRFGTDTERYYLVAPRSGGPSSLEALRGATVRTKFAYDEAYLRRVVFPPEFRPGEAFRLEPAENLADEIFFLLEGDGGGAEALLLDEELKRFFEEDDFVWPDLRIVWHSAPLPRELVVTLGEWSDAERERLLEALETMGESPEGREILELMDSSGFEAVDADLLEEAARRYDAAS